MKPLLVLITAFALTIFAAKIFSAVRSPVLAGNIAMCAMLYFTAVAHFTFTKTMVMMIPAVIPFKKEIVYLTGIAEVAAGTTLLFPAYRYTASVFLIVFFILLLPANINAAFKYLNLQTGIAGGEGPGYLWFRIPLQIFFIDWVWYFGIG